MPGNPDLKPSFFQLARSGLGLLTGREKMRALSLALMMVVVNWLSTGSVIAALLVISSMVQPDSLASNRYFIMVNQALGPFPLETFVTWMALGTILFVILGAIGEWLLEYLLNRFGAACQSRMANQLMERCVNAPYAWFLTRNSTALARFLYDDVAVWNRGFVQRSMTIVDNLIQVIVVAITVLWIISWIGIIAVLLVAMLASLGLLLTRPAISKLSIKKRNALEGTMLSATQVLAGIRDVKLSSRERYFTGHFGETYDITTKTHAMLNVLQSTPPTVLKLVGQVGLMGMVFALWKFGSSTAEIAIQVGLLYLVAVKFVPAASSASSLLGSLWNAAPSIVAIQRLIWSIDESLQQEHRGDDDTKAPVEAWKTISLAGVGFQYPNSSALALKGICLKIERGRAYAIVGQSAAGKSTLVDLLVALLPPSEGRIFVDDQPLEILSLKSWRSKIGYVPQSPYIADSTLRSNVAFGIDQKKVDDAWVRECLVLANLEDLPRQLEMGLDTSLGEKGIRLSGGQRQRIAIARALFNRPEILILDEATSALDTISEKEIMEALENLRQRMTLIIIAHRLTTVMSCDHIFLLEKGSLAAQGSFDELAAGNKLFRQMAAGLVDAESSKMGGG